MKPLFVSIEDGQRVVHWKRLSLFAAALLAATSALSLVLWYLFTQTLSLGATIVGLVVGVVFVVRIIARAVSYQEQELEVETPAPTA